MSKTAKRMPAKMKQNIAHRQEKIKKNVRKLLPLLATMTLVLGVYLFGVLPSRPENMMRKFFGRTVESLASKSMRYDGSFGDTDQGWAGDFVGANGSNGDKSIQFRLKTGDKNADQNLVKTSSVTVSKTRSGLWYKIDGAKNINEILAKIPGYGPVPDAVLAELGPNDGLWRSMRPGESAPVCVGSIADMLSTSDGNIGPLDYPIRLVGGPYIVDDTSELRLYDISLEPAHKSSPTEVVLTKFLSCISTLQGDDYRLRTVTKSEVAGMKFKVTVDPLSGMITKVVWKQMSQYFQMTLRDFNKDIAVAPPANQ